MGEVLGKSSEPVKRRLRLHSFGPFWTISTENQWEITEIGRLSCFSEFFVRFHILCDWYTSDYAHFTFSDTIWLLLLSPNFGTQMITLAETASYSTTKNERNFFSGGEEAAASQQDQEDTQRQKEWEAFSSFNLEGKASKRHWVVVVWG